MQQVKSKERVANHGEVLTGEREVNAMLDLVKQETERIESRFLEPACGTGNFLIEILRRKLRVVKKRYRRSQLEYERYAVLAVSSLYGIDLLQDNVEECRQRLFQVFDEEYTGLWRKKAKESCRAVVRYILNRNIIHGDALSLQTVSDPPEPIVFSEWSFPLHDSRIKRRDFTFSDLLAQGERGRHEQDLFSVPLEKSDTGEDVFIPKEIRSYPLVHFLKLGESTNGRE